MTGNAFTIAMAARLARDMSLVRGEAGCLWESWADPAAIAYLRHMAGRPDPESDAAAGAFTWHAAGDGLAVEGALLGVIVRGIDPVALAEGLEELGVLASAVTPAAAQEAGRTGTELEPLLARHLRQAVATQVGRWPPGVSYALAEGGGIAEIRPLDARPLRQAQADAAAGMQDHRKVVPIRPLPT